jgi:ferrous iron transport protein B
MHQFAQTRQLSSRQMTASTAGGGVVLVGNPNVGKSALFGALTGTYVTVSNYPGTTVEVSEGTMTSRGRSVPVRDTPGAASLIPFSEDERVTRDILLAGAPAAVVVVGDAKNLERTLALALEVCETGLPVVLCLNMIDEASSRGLAIDAARLSSRLGAGVAETVAIRREGLAGLASAIESARPAAVRVAYPDPVERAIEVLVPLLPAGAPLSPRALAVSILAGDQTLTPWLRANLSDDTLARVEDVRQRLRRIYRDDLGYVIQQARRREAGELSREVMARRAGAAAAAEGAGARRLDVLTTHPVWGWPFLAVVLYVAYLFVGVFGAKTLVDLLENGLFGRILSPAATRFANAVIPWALVRDFFVGQYGLVTMALAYSLALVLPIVGTFFIAFGMLEDSGYLPRLAVMLNRAFKSMGLNGKAVLPMVLGLGCDTMATLTTRILETPKERLIVILLLALGVPCSAQLTVVLAMLGGLSGSGRSSSSACCSRSGAWHRTSCRAAAPTSCSSCRRCACRARATSS